MDIITLAQVTGSLSVIGYGLATSAPASAWASCSARRWSPPPVSPR